MATINIGSGYTDFGSQGGTGNSKIDPYVLANGTGSLDTFKVFFKSTGAGVKLGTAYSSGGSGVYTVRDTETIGAVTSGSTQTFTGKSCDVATDDAIWLYAASGGEAYASQSGATEWYKSGDQSGNGSVTYSNGGAYKFAISATGATVDPPSAPTNVSATENLNDKVTVTWTKSAGATGYRVYEGSNDISGLLGDVATFDHTAAAAPVITPGTSVASHGTSTTHVSLSLSGNSIANGTQYTYTVKAVNSGGTSAASASDTGYRVAATVTYQWQKSSGESDASYSDISGGTTASYNDTSDPTDGSIRFFKCKQDATGSSQAFSTANPGYVGTSSGGGRPELRGCNL
jgi:hypothetical protein